MARIRLNEKRITVTAAPWPTLPRFVGDPEHLQGQRFGLVDRTAASHDVDEVEDIEAADECHQASQQEGGPDGRQDDPADDARDMRRRQPGPRAPGSAARWRALRS